MGVDSARSNVASGSSGSRGRSRAAITKSWVSKGATAGAERWRPQLQPRRDSLPGKFAGSRGEADDPVSWSDRTPRLHVEAGVLALTGQIWVVVGVMVDDVPPMLT